jgi:hypothetical protein
MTRGVTMARDRVFLWAPAARTVPRMTTTSPLFRRRRPYFADLLEHDVSVRLAGSHDRRDLERLAALDSSDVPTGRVLTGRVDGELRAAVSLDDGRAIANPFVATRDLVDALRRIAWTS